MPGNGLQKAYEQTAQSVLFQDDPALATATVPLVDLLHALIALADAGEPVLPWLERFPGRQAALRAGLRFLRDERADWSAAIDRVLAIIEGAPLFNPAGAILMAGYLIVEERMMQPSKGRRGGAASPLPWPAGLSPRAPPGGLSVSGRPPDPGGGA